VTSRRRPSGTNASSGTRRERAGQGWPDCGGEYVKKGERIYVEGRIEYRSYQDKENQTRYVTEINVRELMLLGTLEGRGRGGEGERKGRSVAPEAVRSGAGPIG